MKNRREFTHNPSDPTFSDTPTFYKKESYSDEYRTDVLSAVDWLGNRFNVSDRVMYCVGAGRGQMMAIGEVRQMRARQRRALVEWEWDTDEQGRNVRINDVYEDYWDIEVQVLTEKTSGSWDNKQRSRPAWVNPMNITAMIWEGAK